MNAITMLQTSALLLVLTSLGGGVMALVRFIRNSNPPSWLAMAHGFLAAAGLTLLAYAGLTGQVHGNAMVGLILLLLASVGGVVLNLVYHLAHKILPTWLVLLHLGLGLVGTLLVAFAAWAS